MSYLDELQGKPDAQERWVREREQWSYERGVKAALEAVRGVRFRDTGGGHDDGWNTARADDERAIERLLEEAGKGRGGG